MDMWAAQRAKLGTRAAKKDVDRERLRDVWKNAASELGLTSPTLRREGPAVGHVVKKHEIEQGIAQAIVKAALLHLTEWSTVVTERDLMGQVMVRAVGRVGPSEVRSAWCELEALRELMPAEPTEKAPLLRRYTTLDVVKTERRFLGSERRQRGRHQPIVTLEDLDGHLERTHLTEGQRDAVRVALASREGVVGVQGYIVRGYAPSGAAVQALTDEAGVVSSTHTRAR